MIQGAAGSTILACGMSLLSVDASGSGQMRAITAWGAASAAVAAAGPLVGGGDPNRPRAIDVAGAVLIAVVLAPLVLALSEGADWGWASVATLGCLAISVIGGLLFVVVERKVAAPLVDLQLLQPGAGRHNGRDPPRRGRHQRAHVPPELVFPETPPDSP
jgi:MFS family permease